MDKLHDKLTLVVFLNASMFNILLKFPFSTHTFFSAVYFKSVCHPFLFHPGSHWKLRAAKKNVPKGPENHSEMRDGCRRKKRVL